ncbi:MAG: hypothetical protein M3N47_02780 [Chloroflexota bacterium]|nr:hypothetical protein [Chloroflexota bacterium]
MPTDAPITTRYTGRVQPEFVEDDFDGQIWQPDVYEDVARVARAFDARGIIDIGCGERREACRAERRIREDRA